MPTVNGFLKYESVENIMKIAVCSDEVFPIHQLIIDELIHRRLTVVRFGALHSGHEESWAKAAKEAAIAIFKKECDEGIFFCYSATGITMAANKIPTIRAALCNDAETARLARIWNHANVLALSNRTLSIDVAREILFAWFATPYDERGKAGAHDLKHVDEQFRRYP